MQLEDLQAEAFRLPLHLLAGTVHKHAHPLRPLRQVGRYDSGIPGRRLVEHKADEVYPKGFHPADVVAVGHAAHFNEQVHVPLLPA